MAPARSPHLAIICGNANYTAISLHGTDTLSDDVHYSVTVDTWDIAPLQHGLGQAVTLVLTAEDGFSHTMTQTLLAIEDKGLMGASPEQASGAPLKRRYCLTIGSRLGLMGSTEHSRIFVDTPLADILSHLLTGAGYHHSQIHYALATPLPVLPQCVQAMENNHTFFHRLLRQYGLFYFFDSRDGQARLVITDTNQTSPYIARGLVQVHAGEGFNRQLSDIVTGPGEPAFIGFSQCQVAHKMATGLASIMAADSANSTADNQADHNYAQPVAMHHDQAAYFAQQQSLALNSLNQVITLIGNVPDIFAGCAFSLNDASGLQASGDYLCISMEHHCQQPSDETSQDGLSHYHCVVKAIPRATPFKLPRQDPAPLPMVFAARVETLGGKPTLTERGDYYTKTAFDNTAQAPLASSQPLRKLVHYACAHQPQATGWHFPLTQDANVLLGCFNNDPAQAYILGFASNDEQPNVVNSFNHTHNRLLSRSGHELCFDDDRQAPTVILQTLGGAHCLELNATGGAHYLQWVSRFGRLSFIAGDDILLSSADDSINLSAQASQTVDIKGAAQLSADNQRLAMHSALSHQQTAKHITLESEQETTLLTGRSLNVRADSELHLHTEQGNLTLNVPQGSTIINADGDIRIAGTGQGDIILYNQGGMIKLDSQGNVELTGTDVLTLNGQMITFDGNVTYEITSPNTASEPSTPAAPSIAPIADLPRPPLSDEQTTLVPLELNYFDTDNKPVEDIGVEILDSLGQRHTGTLQAGLLTLPDLPLGQCQITYLGTTDADEQLLIEKRKVFKQYLNDMLAEITEQAAREDALFEQQDLIDQWLIQIGATMTGVYEGGKSVVQGIADIVTFAVDVQLQVYSACYELLDSLLRGDIAAIKLQLETILEYTEKSHQSLTQAFALLVVIIEDEETRTALANFPVDYFNAHSYVEKHRIGGIFLFEILLAVLTAGAGAAVSAASKSKYVVKAHKALTEIAEILKRKRLNRQQTHALEPSNTKSIEKIEAPNKKLELTKSKAASDLQIKIDFIAPSKPEKVDWNTSKANGLIVKDPRDFSVGKAIYSELTNKGMEPDLALQISRELLESGLEPPVPTEVPKGFELFKLVPKGSGLPGKNSPYFVTREQYNQLPSDPEKTGDFLGLPQIPTSFDTYKIVAEQDTILYQSKVAPFSVNSGEYVRKGGATQTLVTNRELFTIPEKVVN